MITKLLIIVIVSVPALIAILLFSVASIIQAVHPALSVLCIISGVLLLLPLAITFAMLIWKSIGRLKEKEGKRIEKSESLNRRKNESNE